MNDQMIQRINHLAKKKREQGLTPQETEEQQQLYKEYLAQFRNNLNKQLDNIDIKTPDGKVTPIKNFYKGKNNK